MKSVLTVCLSPTFQKTIAFQDFKEDEVNRSSEYFLSASGKGVNVSKVLLRLGTATEHMTNLGGSRIEEFLSLCRDEGLSVLYVPTSSPIRTCVTVLNKAKGTSTELVEESRPVEEGTEERLLRLYEKEAGRFDAVIVSGNRASGYSERLYPELTRIAKEKGCMIILDARGKDLLAALPYGPDVIKPNLSEFAATFLSQSRLMESDGNEALRGDVERIAAGLFHRHGIKTVVSRGRYDTWVYDGEGLKSIPNADVPVVNTIGCGDTLTGAMTHALLDGKSLAEAVAFGMARATERAQRTEF